MLYGEVYWMYYGRIYSMCQVQFLPPYVLFTHQIYPLAFSNISFGNVISLSSDLSRFPSQMHKIIPIGVLVNKIFSLSFIVVFFPQWFFVLKSYSPYKMDPEKCLTLLHQNNYHYQYYKQDTTIIASLPSPWKSLPL